MTANSLQDGVSRLSWAWDDERRHHWALDQARAARRLTDLRAERGRLVATIPPDVTAELADARAELNLHEATSGAPDDTAPHLLTRIARLEDEATARRAYLRANPQVLQQIREIDRLVGEQRRTVGRLNAALRQGGGTTRYVDAAPEVVSRGGIEV